jgi:hypothetical protein
MGPASAGMTDRVDSRGTLADMKPGFRTGLQAGIGLVLLLVGFVVVREVSARKAYARADAFCAANSRGTSARDVTIHALDQKVQVRTDLELGALVVRFEAWGPSSAAGECHLAVAQDHVTDARVVRQ